MAADTGTQVNQHPKTGHRRLLAKGQSRPVGLREAGEHSVRICTQNAKRKNRCTTAYIAVVGWGVTFYTGYCRVYVTYDIIDHLLMRRRATHEHY
jgi:hypothetical protein